MRRSILFLSPVLLVLAASLGAHDRAAAREFTDADAFARSVEYDAAVAVPGPEQYCPAIDVHLLEVQALEFRSSGEVGARVGHYGACAGEEVTAQFFAPFGSGLNGSVAPSLKKARLRGTVSGMTSCRGERTFGWEDSAAAQAACAVLAGTVFDVDALWEYGGDLPAADWDG